MYSRVHACAEDAHRCGMQAHVYVCAESGRQPQGHPPKEAYWDRHSVSPRLGWPVSGRNLPASISPALEGQVLMLAGWKRALY